VPVRHQFGHLPIEERQQQRADVRAVDVGIGHDDDLVVAQFGEVEPALALLVRRADAGAERRDDVGHLLRRQHLVATCALDIEDLAADRQHGLVFALARLLGRAAGAVTLDDEHLGIGSDAIGAFGKAAG
jgi:hypothetical protein